MTEKKDGILDDIYKVIVERKKKPKEGSYVNYLLSGKYEKLFHKVEEEAKEVVDAAKRKTKNGVIWEATDLMFYLLVLMAANGVKPEDIYLEFARRRKG